MKVSPFSAASPDMTDSEMDALTVSIRDIGQQVPILTWRGEVIDGRKRLAACERLGVAPITHDIGDDANPEVYALALNVCRTHYSASQRAMFAAKVATATKADGGRMAHAGAGNYEFVDAVTVSRAAKAFGVGVQPVAAAKRLRRTADPEVVAHVERGDLTLHKAEQIAALPKEDQAATAARIVALPKEKRRYADVVPLVKDTVRRGPRVDPTRALHNLFVSLEVMASALESMADSAAPTDEEAARWVAAHESYTRAARPLVARLKRESHAG